MPVLVRELDRETAEVVVMTRDATERPPKELVDGAEVEEVVHAVAETAVVAKARRERRANCMVILLTWKFFKCCCVV